jgi:hypothetical protein
MLRPITGLHWQTSDDLTSSLPTFATKWAGRSSATHSKMLMTSSTSSPLKNSASIQDTAARIQEIKRLRPLSTRQPWGIFFVKFEPKRLARRRFARRILGQVALKKRSSANSAERAACAADDLLLSPTTVRATSVRSASAHFARRPGMTVTRRPSGFLAGTAVTPRCTSMTWRDELTTNLAWPDDDTDTEEWRAQWRAAFTLGHREVITTAKDLSIRLAEPPASISDRIQTRTRDRDREGPLTQLMKAFRGALIHDLKPGWLCRHARADHRLRPALGDIADPQKKTVDDFAAHMRTNPFLRELMETFLKVGGRRQGGRTRHRL